MPASNAFVEGLLDVVDKHISSFGGNKKAKLAFAADICLIPPGNMSVAITQKRILDAAEKRWG